MVIRMIVTIVQLVVIGVTVILAVLLTMIVITIRRRTAIVESALRDFCKALLCNLLGLSP